MATEPEIPTTGEPLFDTEQCSLPSIETVAFRFINDCFVPAAPPPIQDCPDLLINIPPAGEPGTAGVAGPVGPQGPPGTVQPWALDDCEEILPTIYVLNDLNEVEGQVIRVDEKCFTVRKPNPVESSIAMAIGPTAVAWYGPFEDCESCRICWKLTRCDDFDEVKYTNTDLSAYRNDRCGCLNFGDLLDSIAIRIEGDDHCWFISLAGNDCEDPEDVVVTDHYINCATCRSCYHMEICRRTDDASDSSIADVRVSNNLARIADRTPTQLVDAQAVFTIGVHCYKVVSYELNCDGTFYDDDSIAYHDGTCDDCGCFKLTQCNPDDPEDPAILYVSDAIDAVTSEPLDLADYIDQIVRLDDGICYLVEDHAGENCEEATGIVVQEAYVSCDNCLCYRLTNCADEEDTLLTYTDLAGFGATTGMVVRRTSDGVCFEITGEEAWDVSAVSIEIDEGPFDNCEDCAAETKYRLTNDCFHADCDEDQDAGEIVTEENLHGAVGKFVKVKGICYTVAVVDSSTPTTDVTLDYQGPFETCDECVKAPVTTKKRVCEIFVESGSFIKRCEEWIFEDGVLVSVCHLDGELLGCACIDSGVPCSYCTAATTPKFFDVTLSGFTNNTCTECADLNATWHVPQVDGEPCSYYLEIATCDDSVPTTLTVTLSSSLISVDLNINGTSAGQWTVAVDDPYDCSAARSLDHVANMFFECNYTPAAIDIVGVNS